MAYILTHIILDREKMVKLEKSNEILEKRLKQLGDETDTDGKVTSFLIELHKL